VKNEKIRRGYFNINSLKKSRAIDIVKLMTEVRVRDLEVKDLEQIYEKGVLTSEFLVGEETGFYGKDYLSTWINNKKDDILLVAERKGKIIGFLFCRVMLKTWAMGENIYVVKEKTENQVEKLLFDECQRRLKNLEIDYIGWLVRPRSSEEKFTRIMGFKSKQEEKELSPS